ncbi:MAG: DUF2202 domain-containing protein [Burkholderiales bacterium]|nr:DUF2202 domain-containing protein [Burkholderiales bacterium]
MAESIELDRQEERALLAALDDEYKSHATYDQVIRDFGPVRPFVNIVEAEARHIAALVTLFDRYGLPVPPDPWPGKAPRYQSVDAACVAAVQAEIDNAALYDRLLASTRRPDILAVLQALRSASQDRHLPAFQRCAQRSADGGGHSGAGRRMRARGRA